MPIYEYGCYDCHKRVSIFFRTIAEAEKTTPHCPRCGGTNLKRLMSRVARLRSEDERLDSLADPANFGAFDENDPKSLAKFMKTMTRELGDEIGDDLGPEFDEVVDRLEKGQSPEEIEKEMPELGEETAGGSAGGAGDDWFG